MPLKQTYLFDFDEDPSPEVSEPELRPEPEKEVPAKNKRGRRKLSELAVTADLIDVPNDEILFQKKYYSIGISAELRPQFA